MMNSLSVVSFDIKFYVGSLYPPLREEKGG